MKKFSASCFTLLLLFAMALPLQRWPKNDCRDGP